MQPNPKGPVMLIVLDGWGYRKDSQDNAIAGASKPRYDALLERYPNTLLDASGPAVGLPEGQMGNSEVGHMTMGAGTVIDTDLVRINKEIASGAFGKNPAISGLFEHVREHGSTLHALGLIGTGGVHSHSGHLFAFLRAAREAGIEKVAVHAFTDGRDTPPQSARAFLEDLEAVAEETGARISTISGRYYAMDRDKNWDRTARAEDAIFRSQGLECRTKPSEFASTLYEKGENDEYFEPVVCYDGEGRTLPVSKNDGLFFFNFRADRARQLSSRILERQKEENWRFVTMTVYSADFDCGVAYAPFEIKTTLAAEISKAGLAQAHIAETEKYAHATYFLNGGREEPYPGEEHILVPSRKDVKTHDMAPEMKAKEISDKAIEQIGKGTPFIFINYANADMVGHTGNVPAILTAVETIDRELDRVLGALEKAGGVAFVTADHGNAEINVDPETGIRHTAHTTSKVPAILTREGVALAEGGLKDVAPTVLELFGLAKPDAMTGESLMRGVGEKE